MSRGLSDRLALARALTLRDRIDALRLMEIRMERVPQCSHLRTRVCEAANDLVERDLRLSELDVASQTLRQLAESDGDDIHVFYELRDLHLKQLHTRGEERRVEIFGHEFTFPRRPRRVKGAE